jgi:hypothetical protein
MSAEINPIEENGKKINVQVQNSSNPVYGIGLIGAWVWYIGRATTPRDRLRGFFKAFAWPAILVYELLKFFQKE